MWVDNKDNSLPYYIVQYLVCISKKSNLIHNATLCTGIFNKVNNKGSQHTITIQEILDGIRQNIYIDSNLFMALYYTDLLFDKLDTDNKNKILSRLWGVFETTGHTNRNPIQIWPLIVR